MNIEAFVVGFLGTNCYLVHDGKSAVIIDPGADGERILARAEDLGVKIEYVFLTHGHFDHTMSVKGITDKTGARLVSTEGERLRLTDASVSGHTMLRNREFTPLYADVEVRDGEIITVGDMKFMFLITPGHTEGSVCIMAEDVIFSGDTLFKGTCGRCDLAGGDISDMFKSLRRLYELSGDYRVLPGHEEETTLSRERTENPYMAEAIRR